VKLPLRREFLFVIESIIFKEIYMKRDLMFTIIGIAIGIAFSALIIAGIVFASVDIVATTITPTSTLTRTLTPTATKTPIFMSSTPTTPSYP
jgi:hypothetical protein